jgi:PKD repeat protein
MSYDLFSESSKELASTNYFNDVLIAKGSVYYSPAVYKVNGSVGLFKINADGTNKKTATSFIRFTVAPPPANQPPVALFTVDSNNVLAPATIIFTDASTDADGKIVSWLWEFETGSSLFYNAQTYQKTVFHTFTKSGTYSVKLTVTDDGNLKNTYILDIFVKNNAPIAILTASQNPALSQTQVSFFGNTSYDIDGTIVKYAWDFGDTTIISQGRTIESHTYAKPGTYKASLTITDNLGDISTANLFINVSNRSPVARITYTTLTAKAPGSLTFNGDTSSDIDGTIALSSFDNTRRFIRISIYLAAGYYRLADLKNAEKYLSAQVSWNHADQE